MISATERALCRVLRHCELEGRHPRASEVKLSVGDARDLVRRGMLTWADETKLCLTATGFERISMMETAP